MNNFKFLALVVFSLALIVSSCKKEEEEPFEPECFENPQPNISLTCSGYCFDCEEEPVPTNDVWFKGNIDGTWVMFQSGNTNGSDFKSTIGQSYRVEASGAFKDPDNPIKNFAFIQILSYGLETSFVEDTTIYETWEPDIYYTGDARYNTPGFILEYTDQDGTTWTTQNDNSSGSLVINQRTPLNDNFFYVSGTFQTKLWLDNGTSLINNVSGEFRTVIRTR